MTYDENHFRLSLVEVLLTFVVLSDIFFNFIVRFDDFTPPSSPLRRRKVTKTHFWNLEMWICHCITLNCIFISGETDLIFFFIFDHSNTIKVWLCLLISIDLNYCADASTPTNQWFGFGPLVLATCNCPINPIILCL